MGTARAIGVGREVGVKYDVTTAIWIIVWCG